MFFPGKSINKKHHFCFLKSPTLTCAVVKEEGLEITLPHLASFQGPFKTINIHSLIDASVQSLQPQFILTMSHWSSGLTLSFPS